MSEFKKKDTDVGKVEIQSTEEEINEFGRE